MDQASARTGWRAAVVQLRGELGQRDVRAQHAAEVLEQFGEAAAGQQRPGQDLVPGDQPLKLGVVVRGLRVRHQLGDGDERGLVRHFHHRQSPAVCLRQQGRRHRLVRQPDPEADAHRAGPLDLPDKAALLRGGASAAARW